uniref:Uncharacterized protein LOC111109380 n=1 Tax=Crassostrea virginica TaxID=6565 RepID=A0A8B8BCM4_CRAVI|nr:uncharacterized protein LOC111109380 [Crassostrea virginica]
MALQTTTFLFLLAELLICPLIINECKQLDGYKFPVYTTEFCPRNETEWLERSSLFNCTGEDNTYACFPNDEITELIEFCYPLQVIAIPKGLCLFLSKRRSQMEAYVCSTFEDGCPTTPYRGSTVFKL